jgi:hypothetical protein
MCGEYNTVYGTVDSISPTRPHGGNGGVPLEAWCTPPDRFISSIRFSIRYEDKIARYVDGIEFTCISLTKPNDPPEKHCLGNEITCGNMGKGFGALHAQECNGDEAASGIRGKDGSYVHALGLMCGPKPGGRTKPLNPADRNLMQGVDLPGSDIRKFMTRNEGICAQACAAEAECRAWTFVKKGSMCWLKHAVPAAVSSSCCISGVMNPVKSMGKKPKPADQAKPGKSMGKAKLVSVEQSVDVCSTNAGCNEDTRIAVLQAGTQNVLLLGSCADNWCHVKWPAGQGWVYDGPDYDSLKY